MLNGLCIVITPLISLMRDQVDQLVSRGIKAKAIYSGMSAKEIDIVLDNCVFGDVKFLYVSPERLKSNLFLVRAEKMSISMIAVDEAHCISQWGYDFRPPYLEIAAFIETCNVKKVVALTATATRQVRADILDKLGMIDAAVFTETFARPNLSYSVFKLESKEEKLHSILSNVPGSAVVYVRSRKRTEQIANWLRNKHFVADFYHAGLSNQEREKKQDAWMSGKTRIIVATNAFGMGIDKADVRVVVHLDLPDTLESYYQEAGRAGRDNKRSYAILLHNDSDTKGLISRIEKSFIPVDEIKRVYQALSNYYKLAIGSRPDNSFDFQLETFCDAFNLSVLETHVAISKLQDNGIVQLDDSFKRTSSISFLVEKEALYRFQIAHPNLEKVIKALLRLYGGELFTELVKLRESQLADFLKVDLKQVVEWLRALRSYDIVDYHEISLKTQLTFLIPRLDPNSLLIDRKIYEARKKLALSKANAVIDYAENTAQCRTRILQKYFDEISDELCGRCDYCLKKAKGSSTEVSASDLSSFMNVTQFTTIDQLERQFPGSNRQKLMSAIRLLVEEGELRVEGDVISKI